MRIVCPSCSAAYDVPDELLRGRRAVRCASCSREWSAEETPSAPAPAPAPAPAQSLFRPEPPPEPALTPAEAEAERFARRDPGDLRDSLATAVAMDRLRASQPRRRGGLGLALAWLFSIAIVAGLLFEAFAWRYELMEAWPATIRVYAALGLAGAPR